MAYWCGICNDQQQTIEAHAFIGQEMPLRNFIAQTLTCTDKRLEKTSLNNKGIIVPAFPHPPIKIMGRFFCLAMLNIPVQENHV